ncbi:unnamed protein product [Ectocarpus sp. CCAP 1310/34]|nr:unnamed protein product [Ectocarpus sp. CCAP 1310/34]
MTTFSTPLTVGGMELRNRFVMCPLTRNRATVDLVPTDREAETSMLVYYEQRATHAGMIIAEATQVSNDGQGYPLTPGIYTPEQIAGWKKITAAVHAKGAKMVCQLWHCGRISHESYQPEGRAPLAPSALACPAGECMTMEGPKPFPVPREMTIEDIKTCVEQFRQGALNVMEAGFDGLEIHAANGYLIDQFLKDSSNKRTDDYGGSLENRFRLLKEILTACQEAIGKDKVAVRLTPGGTFNATKDEAEEATGNHEYFCRQLSGMGLMYLHVKLADDQDVRHGGKVVPIETIRKAFDGVLITNNRYDEKDDFGEGDLGKSYDAVAFGRAFLANPDLPVRVAKKAPLNEWDHTTFFGGTGKGYTDYPFMDA